MDFISLTDAPKEVKMRILSELGFTSDGIYVLEGNGTRVKDKYIDKEVTLSNMLILPGSTIILDNNPLSIASYMEEYKDVF